jgi:hypothetical protein
MEVNGFFFSDNFYTRHTIAEVLHKFTDNEAHLIGTVKFTNVDATNRNHLSKGMELLKNSLCGVWCLVQAYHKHPDYECIWSQHSLQQRHLSSTSTGSSTQFVPPLDWPAEKCGYIVFKDSKLVLFYMNDLLENPAEPVLLGSDARAVQCVHGLAKLSCWTGTEVLNRTDFLVAAPIVAYNMFMNGVDHMDQYHSTLATQCKEMHLQMTLFTFPAPKYQHGLATHHYYQPYHHQYCQRKQVEEFHCQTDASKKQVNLSL